MDLVEIAGVRSSTVSYVEIKLSARIADASALPAAGVVVDCASSKFKSDLRVVLLLSGVGIKRELAVARIVAIQNDQSDGLALSILDSNLGHPAAGRAEVSTFTGLFGGEDLLLSIGYRDRRCGSSETG